MTGRRLALLLAIDQYDDDRLSRLQAPIGDAEALAEVLGDRSLGGFDVDVAINPTSWEVAERLDEVLAERQSGDVVLVHFAGHGLKDDSGDLYLAATNTTPRRLFSTGIPTSLLMRMIRRSPAESVVLLLDCCYGGAFDRVLPRGDDIDLAPQMREAGLPDGRGVAVISASSATEWAYEVPGLGYTKAPATSVFTSALVEGIRSGDADRDRDGNITVSELYEYVEERVRAERPRQTPRKWEFDMRGGALLIARSQRRALAATGLPPEVHEAMSGSLAGTRLGAVHELTVLAEGNVLPLAAAARAAIGKLTDDDSRMVSRAASEALARTEIRLSHERLDLGLVLPYASASQTPPATAKIIGVPVALASTVTASQGIQAWLDGDQLMVTGAPDRPGQIEGVVTVTGPAGEASVEVAGWAAVDPAPFLHEAVRLAGAIVGDPASEIVIVAGATLLAAWSGNKEQAAEWLSGTTGLGRAVADPVERAVAEAVYAWALGECGDSEGAADALARARAAVPEEPEPEPEPAEEDPPSAAAAVPSTPQVAEQPSRLVYGRPPVVYGRPPDFTGRPVPWERPDNWEGTSTVQDEDHEPDDSQDPAGDAEDPNDEQRPRVLVQLLVEWVAARLEGENDGAQLIDAITEVIYHYVPDAGTCSACLAALAWTVYHALPGDQPPSRASGLLDEAEDEARDVEDPVDQGFFLTVVALAWSQIGEPGRALELLADIEEAADGVERPGDISILLSLSAIVAVQAGDLHRAGRLLSKVPPSEVEDDDDDQGAVIGLLAYAWAAARADDSERARTALDDAVTIIRTIKEPEARLLLLGVAAFAASLVDDERTVALVDEALDFCGSVTDPWDREISLFLPAWLRAQRGGPPTALVAASGAVAAQHHKPMEADAFVGILTMLALAWTTWWTGAAKQATELLAELESVSAELSDDIDQLLVTAAFAWVSTQVADRDRGLQRAMELVDRAMESDESENDDPAWTAVLLESAALVSHFGEQRPDDALLRIAEVLLPAGPVTKPLEILRDAWISLFRRLVLAR